MLVTPHVIVAAAIAYKIGNPALSLPLALGSHFILEKVPHWNPHLNTEIRKFGKLTKETMRIIIADCVLALFVGFFIASKALPDIPKAIVVLIACFLGVLPDLAEAPYFLWHKTNRYLNKLLSFQKVIQNDTTLFPGIINQILTIVAALIWIG